MNNEHLYECLCGYFMNIYTILKEIMYALTSQVFYNMTCVTLSMRLGNKESNPNPNSLSLIYSSYSRSRIVKKSIRFHQQDTEY